MKKILLLSVFFILSLQVFSQGVRIGLNFSPALSFNRVASASDANQVSYSNSGVGMRFIAGPEIYFFLSRQFAITTGVWYNTRREGLNFQSKEIPGYTTFQGSAYYNLQTLQIPLTMRMYTNEIATNTRIYFQLGGSADFVLKAKEYKADNPLVQGAVAKFSPIGASLIIASGVEFKLGESNFLMLGIRYTRGLTNTITKMNYSLSVMSSKPDMFSLDVGFRF